MKKFSRKTAPRRKAIRWHGYKGLQMTDKEQAWKAIVEVEQAETFHFPQGMVGFPDANDYVMLNSGHGDIVCMQATLQVEAAFLVTPWDEHRLGKQPKLAPDQHECLQGPDENKLLWLLVLNPFSDPKWVSANLRAPVAINLDTSLGMQCIQANPQLDLHFHWMQQQTQTQQAA